METGKLTAADVREVAGRLSPTAPLEDGNPDPAPSTAAVGLNGPLTPQELADLVRQELRDKGTTFIRLSKHRAGRARPLTKKQRAKRDGRAARALQARMSITSEHNKDATALMHALDVYLAGE